MSKHCFKDPTCYKNISYRKSYLPLPFSPPLPWIQKFYQILIQNTSNHCTWDLQVIKTFHKEVHICPSPAPPPPLSSHMRKRGEGSLIQKFCQILIKNTSNNCIWDLHVIKAFHKEAHFCPSLIPPIPPLSSHLKGKDWGKSWIQILY